MNNYEILGVDSNASRDEIKKSYEGKVAEIKQEVKNEKNAEAFIKILDKAYDEINKLDTNIQNINIDNTVLMNPSEINQHLNNPLIKEEGQATGKQEVKKEKVFSKKKNTAKSKQKKKSSGSSSNNNNTNKKNNRSDESIDKKRYKDKNKVKNRESSIGMILLPVKILAFPLIVILTLVILILKIISMATWLVSKVLIIAGIALISVHCYQIYSGDPRDIKLFILAGIVIIIAICLPYIIKLFPALLEKINNGLKSFVFN